MKRLALAVLLLLGIAHSASAQMTTMGVTAPRYFGPADVATPTVCWSMRACGNGQLTGSVNSTQLRRASDSTTQDIVILTTGAFDTASAATFLAATSGFYAKFYAQIGTTACGGSTCDAVQGTAGNQPTYVTNCSGANSCAQALASASSFLVGANNLTPASGVVSMMGVYKRTGSAATGLVVRENGNNNLIQTSSANVVIGKGGASAGIGAAAADGAFHCVVTVVNGASSFVMVDGTITTGTTTGNTTAGTPVFLQGGSSTTPQGFEGLIWDGVALTGAQAATLCSGARGYWGF